MIMMKLQISKIWNRLYPDFPSALKILTNNIPKGNMTKKNCKIWENVPNCLTTPHTTLGTKKFRNILLFEGNFNLIVVLTLRTAN